MNLCCNQYAMGQAGVTANPPMSYDSTLGTPTAQGIVPPFQNLPAMIYDIHGTGNGYNWNYTTAAWV